MEQFFFNIIQKMLEFAAPAVVFVSTVIIGYGIGNIFFRRLVLWSRNTKPRVGLSKFPDPLWAINYEQEKER